jgi:EF hand
MKRQFQLNSTIIRRGIRIFLGCFLANGLALQAQLTTSGGPGGEFGLVINGSDMGTILLKACDLDQNGNVMLYELKQVALAYFRVWDTNADSSVSGNEISTALMALFPAPSGGGVPAMAVVNGVAVDVAPSDLQTPDRQLAKHILAAADSNKDGLLSFQELNAWLDQSFSQWDLDANGLLNAQELNIAFSQLAAPDAVWTVPVHPFFWKAEPKAM